MAYKVKIDNVEFDLKDNFVVKDELNETLDSATIQFNTYGHEANFESFDVAQIYDSENKISKKYFLVDSFDDEIYSFGDNFETDDHLYTVSLFSETKELERITLPNCSVTQPTSGTKKSVYQEIERFCSLYLPRVKVGSSRNSYSYQRKFALDPELESRFRNIECPEFQWNNPTLREVLNDLVSTDDCIIVARQGIISFYDLRKKGNPIDVSKLSFSKKTMSSQDYVGELTVDMQNAIGKEPSLICEGITLRAPEGETELTTVNGVIKASHPIYAIKRLRIKCNFHIRTGNSDEYSYQYAWIDITDRVLEKEEFDLLSSVKIRSLIGSAYQNLPDFTDQNGVTEKKHKVNFLYFKRGGDEILNLGTLFSAPVYGPNAKTSFAEYGIAQITSHLYNIGVSGGFGIDDFDPRDYEFYLEYETLAEHSIHVGKNLPVKHPDNRIFDNQSNSYVDQEHMSILEYAKINRLGHKLRTIAGDYYQESEVPKLGDYIGDEILFSREITYEDNIIKFKGMLTPNYVLKDFFTGVRARKRSWQIAKNEDALTRHDVYKFYVETSFSKKEDTFNYSDANGIVSLRGDVILPYLIPFNMANAAPYQILGCAVQTKDKNDSLYPGTDNYVLLDTQNAILGRSFCVDFGFNDNYKSADYIVIDDGEQTQEFYAYADGNGEYVEGNLMLFEIPLKAGTDAQTTETTKQTLVDAVHKGRVMPKISSSEIGNTSSHTHLFVARTQKDNREIIKHTLQFEFCSDTKDIIVTKTFLDRIIYVDKSNRSANDFVVYASADKYIEDEQWPKGSQLIGASIEKSVSNQSVKITIKLNGGDYSIPSGSKSWAIADSNTGRLLLGVNLQQGQTNMSCWFNLLRSRDDKIYSDTYNGIVVDNLAGRPVTRTNENLNETASETVNVQGRAILRRNAITGNNENE